MATNEKVEINVENGITTMVHEMKMNGCHLVDRKQRTITDDVHYYGVDGYYGHRMVETTVLNHSRFIDDRSYTVHETLTEGKRVVRTQSTQEEVERFEEDWINLWNPKIDTTFFSTENL